LQGRRAEGCQGRRATGQERTLWLTNKKRLRGKERVPGTRKLVEREKKKKHDGEKKEGGAVKKTKSLSC